MDKSEYKKIDVKKIIILAILVVVLISILMMVNHYRNHRDELINLSLEELESQYINTLSVYSEMAEAIFRLGIDRDEVKSIIYNGYKSKDSKLKDRYREELQDNLNPLYNEIIKHNFRQLHFHEANNYSFLRMHRPEKFGDDLTNIRYTVKYVNENRESITGFEEGRIYNGYRFVYPINLNGEHLGSVEVSASINAVVELLTERFHHPSQFILQRDIIDNKVFSSEKSNYTPWIINDDFVLDREIAINEVLVKNIADIDRINRALIKERRTPFSVKYSKNNSRYILFYPIFNLEKKHVAYLISIREVKNLKLLKSSSYIIMAILILILLSLIFFLYYYSNTQKKLVEISTHDFLTGALLRRTLLERMEIELSRFNRYNTLFSIIMVDIDHFKLVNDNWGHHIGDLVLARVVKYIKGTIRKSDSIGRYGGEEFILILPGSNLTSATNIAEKIREGVKGLKLNSELKVTISCGVAEYSSGDISELITLADEKLYRAKEEGRDRVIN